MVKCLPYLKCPTCTNAKGIISDAEYVKSHDMPDYMLFVVKHAQHSRFHDNLFGSFLTYGRLTVKQIAAVTQNQCYRCASRSSYGYAAEYPEGRNDIGEAMGGKYDQSGYDGGVDYGGDGW